MLSVQQVINFRGLSFYPINVLSNVLQNRVDDRSVKVFCLVLSAHYNFVNLNVSFKEIYFKGNEKTVG